LSQQARIPFTFQVEILTSTCYRQAGEESWNFCQKAGFDPTRAAPRGELLEERR
jgi:hypothetical protein